MAKTAPNQRAKPSKGKARAVRKTSVKKCARKTSVKSKVKKLPKKRRDIKLVTIKMGLRDMVLKRVFFENLNKIAVRASKVAILGSLNVYYEFQRAFNANDFARVEQLKEDIKSTPERFFNGVRAKGRGIVNRNDHTRIVDEYFIRYGIELQPPDGMCQVLQYIGQQYRTNLMVYIQQYAVKRVIACLLIYYARRTPNDQPIDDASKKKVGDTISYLFRAESRVAGDPQLLKFLQNITRIDIGDEGTGTGTPRRLLTRGRFEDCYTRDGWHKYILPFMRLQKAIIEHNRTSSLHKMTEWCVFPIYSYQRKFIQLDRLSLLQIYNLGREGATNVVKQSDDFYHVFKKCLDLGKLSTAQQERFAFSARTDGCALDLLFIDRSEYDWNVVQHHSDDMDYDEKLCIPTKDEVKVETELLKQDMNACKQGFFLANIFGYFFYHFIH